MSTTVENTSGFFAVRESDDLALAGNAHRQLIGYVGLLLPVLLWLITGWRPIDGLQPWKPLTSVSAYYYTGAVAAFTGMLVVLALFLFSYPILATTSATRARSISA